MAAKRRTTSRAQALPLLAPPLPDAYSAPPEDRLKAVDDRRRHNPEAMDEQFRRIRAGEGERRSFRERRASGRLNVELPVHAAQPRDRAVARFTTHDLSTFGLSIRGMAPLAEGTRLQLTIFLPDAPDVPLTLEAHVLGALDDGEGVRVKFLRPPLAAVRRIHLLVK